MSRNIFFKTGPNGNGKSLFTVPGQMLTSRTRLEPNFMTHGCESVRKKFPMGTVFYADSTSIRFRKGCYYVLVLHPLMLPDGKPASDDLFLEPVLEEYRGLVQKEL